MAALSLEELWQKELKLAEDFRHVVQQRGNGKCGDSLEREADLLVLLGGVYHDKASHEVEILGPMPRDTAKAKKDFGHYTKASALFNAASIRTSRDDVIQRINDELYLIWSNILNDMGAGRPCSIQKRSAERRDNKVLLERVRQNVKHDCEQLGKLWTRYDVSKCNQTEESIITLTQNLGKQVSEEVKGFLKHLLSQCKQFLGEEPCGYAVLGLGSLARDESTPYSDIEFAILIEDIPSPRKEDAKRYFRNLTYLLHLQVLDLGETILPSMAIPSLNDFYKIHDGSSWYFDDITPSGFKFDGDLPWACKTPLGRKKIGKMEKPEMELICTPCEMADYLEVEQSLKHGYHLADILSTCTLIDGDASLLREFSAQSKVAKDDCTEEHRGLVSLRESLQSTSSLSFGNDIVSVKHDIYRLPSLIINCLRLMYDVESTTPWEVIDSLQHKGVITSEARHNLKLYVSISCGLRIMTYTSLGRQRENLSLLPSYTQEHKGIYRMDNKHILEAYISVELPTRELLQTEYLESRRVNPMKEMKDPCRLTCEFVTGLVHFLRREFEDSIEHQLADANVSNRRLLLALTYAETKQYDKALEQYLECLKYARQHGSRERLISDLVSVGHIVGRQREYDQAEKFFNEALDKIHQFPGDATMMGIQAGALLGIAVLYKNRGDYDKAQEYGQNCLDIIETHVTVGRNDLKLCKSLVLNILVACHVEMFQYKEALALSKSNIQLAQELHGLNTAHPNIAQAVYLKADALRAKGDLDEARDLLSWALNILMSSFSKEENRDLLADCHKCLGRIYYELKEDDNALTEFEKAERLLSSKHLMALGSVITWVARARSQKCGNIPRALGEFKKAYSMVGRLKQGHPYRLELFYGWGSALHRCGEYEQAADRFRQCLHEYGIRYGDLRNNFFIAVSTEYDQCRKAMYY